jgi:SAM-dependent methyltransferase
MPNECTRCGFDEAYLINSAVRPDFDISILPPDTRAPFLSHLDGICANCGLYQAYLRFSEDQLDAINGIGKDAMTTEEAYHEYPIPEAYIDAWYGNSLERQRRSWRRTFDSLGLRPKRVLFLRYWFGRIMKMFADEFGAEVYAVDISPICVRHVKEHYPFVKHLPGSINGCLKGEMLDGPPFDGVIVQHILVHSVDVPRAIGQLRHLVRDGGFVLLSAETKVAPSNPFHKFYPSEYQLTSMLRDEFDEVYKLDESGIIVQADWRRYSGKAIEFLGVLRPRRATPATARAPA